MKKHKVLQLIALLLFLSFGLMQCQQEAKDKASGQGASVQKAASLDCAHCGMPSQDYPKWQVKSYFPEKGLTFFCSPKCFFFYQQKQGVAADSAWVPDFYSTERIDALNCYYITGSDVLGPMGNDLVPVYEQEAGEEFMKDHRGKKILKFNEINESTMQEL